MAQRTEKVAPVQQMTDDDHITVFKNLETARSESQKSAGECGAILKQYEKLGGNKKALTTFYGLRKSGDEKATDFMRSLQNLFRIFGMETGPDMVDMMEAAPVEEKPKTKAPAKKSVQSRVAKIKERVIAKEADKAANDLAKPAPGYAGFVN